MCRTKVDMHVEAQSSLKHLQAVAAAERGADCPNESEWPWIAAGLKTGSDAEALLRHAARCEHCGPLLRQSLGEFRDEVTDEEEISLAALEGASREWQE